MQTLKPTVVARRLHERLFVKLWGIEALKKVLASRLPNSSAVARSVVVANGSAQNPAALADMATEEFVTIVSELAISWQRFLTSLQPILSPLAKRVHADVDMIRLWIDVTCSGTFELDWTSLASVLGFFSASFPNAHRQLRLALAIPAEAIATIVTLAAATNHTLVSTAATRIRRWVFEQLGVSDWPLSAVDQGRLEQLLSNSVLAPRIPAFVIVVDPPQRQSAQSSARTALADAKRMRLLVIAPATPPLAYCDIVPSTPTIRLLFVIAKDFLQRRRLPQLTMPVLSLSDPFVRFVMFAVTRCVDSGAFRDLVANTLQLNVTAASLTVRSIRSDVRAVGAIIGFALCVLNLPTTRLAHSSVGLAQPDPRQLLLLRKHLMQELACAQNDNLQRPDISQSLVTGILISAGLFTLNGSVVCTRFYPTSGHRLDLLTALSRPDSRDSHHLAIEAALQPGQQTVAALAPPTSTSDAEFFAGITAELKTPSQPSVQSVSTSASFGAILHRPGAKRTLSDTVRHAQAAQPSKAVKRVAHRPGRAFTTGVDTPMSVSAFPASASSSLKRVPTHSAPFRQLKPRWIQPGATGLAASPPPQSIDSILEFYNADPMDT